jgi:nitroreductase
MNEGNEPTGTIATGRSLAEVAAGLSMPLEEAMLTQRAIRRLLPDPVDDAIVLRCIELALHAPTGSNGQNWDYVIVKDRATKARIARMNRQAWTLYGGLSKRVNRGNESMQRLLAAVEWQSNHFEEIPGWSWPASEATMCRSSRCPRWLSRRTTARSIRASRTCSLRRGPWGWVRR